MAGALLSRSRKYALATVQMEGQASPGEQPADEFRLLSRAISAHSVATTECSTHRRSPRPIRRSGVARAERRITLRDEHGSGHDAQVAADLLGRAMCDLA